MKFYAIKTLTGLKPSAGEDFDKLKLGKEYLIQVKRPRNIKFHKKYFALINLCYKNQEHYNNKIHFRKVMEMKAGHYDAVKTDKGTIFLPKSIAFGSISEGEFNDLYNGILIVLAEFLGMDGGELDREVEAELMGFY